MRSSKIWVIKDNAVFWSEWLTLPGPDSRSSKEIIKRSGKLIYWLGIAMVVA